MILFRTPPVSRPFETYQDVRRKTLNFEINGGEHHSTDDNPDQPMIQIYNYLAHAAKRLLTRSH
jgi:hypothetical protein